jgi:hypothetical protein
LSGQNPATNLQLMIECVVIQHPYHRVHRTRLRIIRAINQPPDSGMHNCPRTHGARFNRYEQFAINEAVIAYSSSGLA